MQRRTLIALSGMLGSIAFVLSAVGASLAQAPVDFSGRWTIPAPAPGAAPALGAAAVATSSGDMGSGWGSPLTITQDASRLSVEYTVFSRYDLQPPFVFVYALDGSESRNAVSMGRGTQSESSRASWNGTTLTITSTFAVADPGIPRGTTITVTRKLSLESPTTLVVESTRSGILGGPATSARTVYQKS